MELTHSARNIYGALAQTTVTQLVDEVLALAKAHPTARYTRKSNYRCSYVSGIAHDGVWEAQGCLFGQAIQALGVSADVLKQWEIMTPESNIHQLIGDLGVQIDDLSLLQLLPDVQFRQDSRWNWNICVRDLRAEREGRPAPVYFGF